MKPTAFTDLPWKTILPGMHGKFIHSKTMTFAYWRLEKGFQLPEHHHPHEQVVHMIKGEFELVVNKESMILKPGDYFIIPPHAVHSGQVITECNILDTFCPVREDYR